MSEKFDIILEIQYTPQDDWMEFLKMFSDYKHDDKDNPDENREETVMEDQLKEEYHVGINKRQLVSGVFYLHNKVSALNQRVTYQDEDTLAVNIPDNIPFSLPTMFRYVMNNVEFCLINNVYTGIFYSVWNEHVLMHTIVNDDNCFYQTACTIMELNQYAKIDIDRQYYQNKQELHKKTYISGVLEERFGWCEGDIFVIFS